MDISIDKIHDEAGMTGFIKIENTMSITIINPEFYQIVYSVVGVFAGITTFFSILITYRDFRCWRKSGDNVLARWQVVLVFFDTFQTSVLFISIGVIIFMIFKQRMIEWAEFVVSCAVQLVSGTNVSFLIIWKTLTQHGRLLAFFNLYSRAS